MKMYILAFATFVTAAGAASAGNDYIGCDFGKRKIYSESDFSNYCGNQNGEAHGFGDRQYSGGTDSSNNNNGAY
jgi:hypothetical protein